MNVSWFCGGSPGREEDDLRDAGAGIRNLDALPQGTRSMVVAWRRYSSRGSADAAPRVVLLQVRRSSSSPCRRRRQRWTRRRGDGWRGGQDGSDSVARERARSSGIAICFRWGLGGGKHFCTCILLSAFPVYCCADKSTTPSVPQYKMF